MLRTTTEWRRRAASPSSPRRRLRSPTTEPAAVSAARPAVAVVPTGGGIARGSASVERVARPAAPAAAAVVVGRGTAAAPIISGGTAAVASPPGGVGAAVVPPLASPVVVVVAELARAGSAAAAGLIPVAAAAASTARGAAAAAIAISAVEVVLARALRVARDGSDAGDRHLLAVDLAAVHVGHRPRRVARSLVFDKARAKVGRVPAVLVRLVGPEPLERDPLYAAVVREYLLKVLVVHDSSEVGDPHHARLVVGLAVLAHRRPGSRLGFFRRPRIGPRCLGRASGPVGAGRGAHAVVTH